jgi:hypothetical protein
MSGIAIVEDRGLAAPTDPRGSGHSPNTARQTMEIWRIESVDEREFWIAFRRWLKGRQSADQQMIDAIERRFGIRDNAAVKDGRSRPVLTR